MHILSTTVQDSHKNLSPYIAEVLIQFGNLCNIILVFSKVMAV